MLKRKDQGELAGSVVKFVVKIVGAATGLGILVDGAAAILGDAGSTKIKEWFSKQDQSETLAQLQHLGPTVVKTLESFWKAERMKVSLDWVALELAQAFDRLPTEIDYITLGFNVGAWQEWFQKHNPAVYPTWQPEEQQAFDVARDHTAVLVVQLLKKLPEYLLKIVEYQGRQIRGWEKAWDERLEQYLTKASGIERLKIFGEEKEYRLNLAEKLDTMELFGAELLEEWESYPLMVSYVSLQLQGLSQDVESFLDGLLSENRLLFIEGAAGSGKSTLLKWMAVTAARKLEPNYERWCDQVAPLRREHHPDESEALPGKWSVLSRERTAEELNYLKIRYDSLWRFQVPFLVRLRDVRRWGGLPQPSRLAHLLAERNGHLSEEWIAELLEQGRCLLLFDGLDEVASQERPETWDRLKKLTQAFKHNRFVLSSRPMKAELGWIETYGYKTTALAPLGPAEKSKLIQYWYQTISNKRELKGWDSSELSPDELRARGKLLQKQLPQPQNRHANLLAEVPLLCALICALFVERKDTQELPRTLPELCERACRMLLELRPRKHDLPIKDFGPIYGDLKYETKKYLVQLLAVKIVEKDDTSLDFANAAGIISRELGKDRCPSESDASDFMHTFVPLCGMLQYGEGDTVALLHNTLKEYLASEYFEEERDWDTLTSHPEKSVVANMALMVAHKPKTGKHLLDRLRQPKKQFTPEQQEAAELLFLRCSALLQLPGEENQKESKRLLQKYLPPQTPEQALAISSFGSEVVPALQYDPEMNPSIAAECVRALSWIEAEDAESALAVYKEKEERHETLDVLTSLCNPLEIKWVRDGVVNTDWNYEHVEGEGKKYRQKINDAHLQEFLKTFQIEQLRELYLNNTQVSKIEGLDAAVQLQGLYLNNTQVSKVEGLDATVQLRELSLSNTQVSKIEGLDAAVQLQRLSLDNTQVSKIEGLDAAVQLRELYLNNTQVSKIEGLDAAVQLQRLYLNNTQVSKIEGLDAAVQLQGLYLNNTQVSKIEGLDAAKQLQVLSLDNTQVSKIEGLDAAKQLQVLSLDNTQVSKIEGLDATVRLRELYLSNTQVSKIEGLDAAVQLQGLYLSNTQVSKIEGLDAAVQLQGLYLSNTQVSVKMQREWWEKRKLDKM